MRRYAAGRIRAPALLLAASVLAAACGSATTTPPGTIPPTGAPPTGALVTLQPSAVITPEPTPEITAGGVARDAGLLTILPAEVEGTAITEEPEAFAEAARDPDFAANVEAAAFPLAVDATDLASGVVARLRPGVWSDAFFRAWRDSYDTGACAQAGGVAGNAEAELGGRVVHVTTCAGGLRVYHAYVESRGVVVSVLSLGDRRFGERIMEGLRG